MSTAWFEDSTLDMILIKFVKKVKIVCFLNVRSTVYFLNHLTYTCLTEFPFVANGLIPTSVSLPWNITLEKEKKSWEQNKIRHSMFVY